jgi:methylated-DNA-[protein]-cysteine S-methyltransferase
MNYKNFYKSILGDILLLSDGENLTGLYFYKQRFLDKKLFNNAEDKELEIFDKTKKWLDIYFSGNEPDFMPKIKLEGTAYRKKIWQELLKIPYAELVSYKDISNSYNKNNPDTKTSPRAVGNAVGHNPISIIVPCHRVIGANGNLTGYGGGIDRKIKLLELEKIDTKNLYYKK